MQFKCIHLIFLKGSTVQEVQETSVFQAFSNHAHFFLCLVCTSVIKESCTLFPVSQPIKLKQKTAIYRRQGPHTL